MKSPRDMVCPCFFLLGAIGEVRQLRGPAHGSESIGRAHGGPVETSPSRIGGRLTHDCGIGENLRAAMRRSVRAGLIEEEPNRVGWSGSASKGAGDCVKVVGRCVQGKIPSVGAEKYTGVSEQRIVVGPGAEKNNRWGCWLSDSPSLLVPLWGVGRFCAGKGLKFR